MNKGWGHVLPGLSVGENSAAEFCTICCQSLDLLSREHGPLYETDPKNQGVPRNNHHALLENFTLSYKFTLT